MRQTEIVFMQSKCVEESNDSHNLVVVWIWLSKNVGSNRACFGVLISFYKSWKHNHEIRLIFYILQIELVLDKIHLELKKLNSSVLAGELK